MTTEAPSVGVAETFERRDALTRYLNEVANPRVGTCLLVQVVDLPDDWFEDYIAVFDQGGHVTTPPILKAEGAGRVRMMASGAWPSKRSGSVWVLLAGAGREATEADAIVLARGGR
jgi:hypothetical protein